ncbi:MAG: AMP-binding protein [Acidimicrobiales bacterium]|jgi:O-succinylbenzoic acid--CoA ligase|nr:AMP-binding protein [Acidimicrobiales bacterium]
MRELVALTAHGRDDFAERLRRIWDGGDAALPVDPRLPPAAVERLYASLHPTVVEDDHGERHRRRDGIPVEDGDALVVATSGSTGAPKGAVHTHASTRASALATSAGVGVDPARDRWLCCLPLAHVAGLSVVIRAMTLEVGLEVLPHFDAEAVEAAARHRGATLTTVVPTALARFDARLFRRIVVGAAAPPADLPPNCLVSYGMTETGSAVTYDGRALDGVELRVVDGEIHVRGPMLLRCYRDAEGGRDPRDADGWFATGDGGELGADGVLVVHGRRGDMINTGGEKVWPTTVEHVLADAPGVADVAVVGRPDPQWGQRVTAVVVPRDPASPPTLAQLRAVVKAQLPVWCAPHGLELVDALPRTLLGKVERHNL